MKSDKKKSIDTKNKTTWKLPFGLKSERSATLLLIGVSSILLMGYATVVAFNMGTGYVLCAPSGFAALCTKGTLTPNLFVYIPVVILVVAATIGILKLMTERTAKFIAGFIVAAAIVLAVVRFTGVMYAHFHLFR